MACLIQFYLYTHHAHIWPMISHVHSMLAVSAMMSNSRGGEIKTVICAVSLIHRILVFVAETPTAIWGERWADKWSIFGKWPWGKHFMIFTAFRFDWNIKITHSHCRGGNVFDALKSHSIDEIQLEKVWQISQLWDWHQKCAVDKILTHHQRFALVTSTIAATPAPLSHLTMAESISFFALFTPDVVERVSYHQFSLLGLSSHRR